MKNELGGKTLAYFFGLRTKTCSQLMDDGGDNKKAKRTKTCVTKEQLSLKITKTDNKDLKAKHTMCLLKKLTKLH